MIALLLNVTKTPPPIVYVTSDSKARHYEATFNFSSYILGAML